MKNCILYCTVSTRKEALKIGEALVESKLAACVNILGETTSIYTWDEQLCSETEVAFIAKTTQALSEKATDFIKGLHSYDCPCIIELPITNGNTDFLNWINKETKQ
ncbi:MAG: divalent-cation tolerance protein CutA [Alphaproteobacteria bacterium]